MFRPWSWLNVSRCCALASVRLVVRELCAPGRLPWLMADALQVAPWLVSSLVVADVSRLRPGARSFLVYARCAPGVPLVLVLSLVACSMSPGGRPGSLVPGRGLMLPGVAPWCSFCPWLMADVSRLRPGARSSLVLARSWFMLDALQVCPWCSLVPGLCLMLSRRSPWCSFRPWLMADASRCAPGARSVPGLCSMRSRCAPGARLFLAYG